VQSDDELERCQAVLNNCIESLYFERVEPSLGEVQRRLRELGWSQSELQLVLPLCARESERYDVRSPKKGKSVLILFRNPPTWFRGWVEPDDCHALTPEVWGAFVEYLNGSIVLKGSINAAAQSLRQSATPLLRRLTLGELRDLIRRGISCGLLVYVGHELHSKKLPRH